MVKMNKLAYGSIRFYLTKDLKYFVMRDIVAKTLWNKLEDKYVYDQEHRESALFNEDALLISYVEGTSMLGHLNAFNKLFVDL